MRAPARERNLRFVDGKWYLDFTFRGKRHPCSSAATRRTRPEIP